MLKTLLAAVAFLSKLQPKQEEPAPPPQQQGDVGALMLLGAILGAGATAYVMWDDTKRKEAAGDAAVAAARKNAELLEQQLNEQCLRYELTEKRRELAEERARLAELRVECLQDEIGAGNWITTDASARASGANGCAAAGCNTEIPAAPPAT